MVEDIGERAKAYALYLPAMQINSALKLANPKAKIGDEDRLQRMTAKELNWFEPGNAHWSYKWCLASAGHMASTSRETAITNRHRDTVVLGDSGGYQIATGALTETQHLMAFQNEPERVVSEWRKSSVKRQIIKWLDAHATYAMTIDMPLWVGMPKNAGRSPFYRCSERQLIDMSVENLEYLQDVRDEQTGAKYLNVLQGFSPVAGDVTGSLASEERWFDAVKRFELQGWSLGGDVGWRGGIYRVLRRILMLRDAGLLASPRDWIHVLGVSTMTWAVYFSAIQRGIRSNVNENMTVSFDSASPYITAGRYQQYAVAPTISDDIDDWVLRTQKLPMGYVVANSAESMPFPEFSPLAAKLTLNDFNPRSGDFASKTTDDLSDELLCNHNVYVYLKAFIGANEAVFTGRGEAPTQLIEAAKFIEKLFSLKEWEGELDARKESLQAILDRSASASEFDDIR